MSVVLFASKIAKSIGLDTRKAYHGVFAASIRAAIREQKLLELFEQIQKIVPDISDQYTNVFDPVEFSRYWDPKLRGLHAFQVRATLDALDIIQQENLTIGDIGDSSGNHASYIKSLAPEGCVDKFVSINLDPVAVEKIRAKGGDAVQCRAEELTSKGLETDLFISFETVEHMIDPIGFLHDLAKNGGAEYLLISVPYQRSSRFGGDHIRLPEDQVPDEMDPEEVHIHEYSPEDWAHLARFSGWRQVFTRTYLQYPRRSLLRLTKPLWRKTDFEGFIILFLKRDLSFSDRYTGW